MPIPPVNTVSTTATTAASTQTQQAANPKKEFKPGSLMYDVVNIKNKPVQQQVGIGIITLGTAIIGFRSVKSFVLKPVYVLLNAAIGLAAGIKLTEAADKLWQAKKAKQQPEPPAEKVETKAEEKA